jgi:hypothetical protein
MFDEEEIVRRTYTVYEGPYHGSRLTMALEDKGYFVICRVYMKDNTFVDLRTDRFPHTERGLGDANEVEKRMNRSWNSNRQQSV